MINKKKISVLVEPIYLEDHSDPSEDAYLWAYKVRIKNNSKESIKLLSRHWKIFDSLKATAIVDGEGVVGKKPVIKPGQVYSYQSGCLLSSPIGAMQGPYDMINLASTKKFRAYIPKFELSAAFALN